LASGDPREQTVAQVPKDQWVILVHKVKVAILDPLAHQDLREAPVSLVSKDNWEILVYQDLKERLDPKENLVRQVLRECLDLRVRKESEELGETPVLLALTVLSVKEALLVTEDSLVLMDCQDQRVLREIVEHLALVGQKVL